MGISTEMGIGMDGDIHRDQEAAPALNCNVSVIT